MDSVIQKEMYNIFCAFATIFNHLDKQIKESRTIETKVTEIVDKKDSVKESFAKSFKITDTLNPGVLHTDELIVRERTPTSGYSKSSVKKISWANFTKVFKEDILKTVNGGKITFKTNLTNDEYCALQSRIGCVAHHLFRKETKKRWGTVSRKDEKGEKQLVFFVQSDGSGKEFYEDTKFIDRSDLIELP